MFGIALNTIYKIQRGVSHKQITRYLKQGAETVKETKKPKTITPRQIQGHDIKLNNIVYIAEAKFVIGFISENGISITSDNQAVAIGFDTELFQQLRNQPNVLPNDPTPTLYSKINVGDKLWHSMCGWCKVSKKQNATIYLAYKGTEVKVTSEGKVSEHGKTIVAFLTLEDYSKYHLNM
jgi:hypothetical protein